MLVALGWKLQGFDVTLQKHIRNSLGDEFEVDVVAIRGSECKLLECKGRHAEYLESVDDLERHFKLRCEAASDEYGWDVCNLHQNVEAIYVTSGGASPDAAAYAARTTRSHKITCSFWDRSKLLGWLNDLGQPRLGEIIKKHYRTPD